MNSAFEFRQLHTDEIDDALAMVWGVFLKYVAPDYQQQGIDEFQTYINPLRIREAVAQQKLMIWGCCDGQKLVGILALKPPCHISLMFVEGDYHHKGIARTLFEMVREYCLMQGGNKLTVHSSPYAKGVYQHLGFHETQEEQIENGIRYIPMEYHFR